MKKKSFECSEKQILKKKTTKRLGKYYHGMVFCLEKMAGAAQPGDNPTQNLLTLSWNSSINCDGATWLIEYNLIFLSGPGIEKAPSLIPSLSSVILDTDTEGALLSFVRFLIIYSS